MDNFGCRKRLKPVVVPRWYDKVDGSVLQSSDPGWISSAVKSTFMDYRDRKEVARPEAAWRRLITPRSRLAELRCQSVSTDYDTDSAKLAWRRRNMEK